MKPYRVKVETYVLVQARSLMDARAQAELAVRQAVADAYRADHGNRLADGWEAYGFRARAATVYDDGGADDGID